uniref:Uncharacterized protein n=1 Tax=Brassica oleracea TaxID=3712 RepID=A0A3P6DGH6_BRAOL|nr:unnamed protein product [Brassica oleracea]
MTHYNKLSEVSYNPKDTSWHFRVKIHRIYPFYFYVTSSVPFYKYVLADEEVHIIDPLNNRLFMDFKNIHAIPHMYHRDRNYPIGYFGPPDLWLETEGGLSDFRFNPRLPEVEEFRQSLLRSDPYVQRYGVVCLL